MTTESRTCQNCKSDFAIEQEDFAFYEKIRVPPPTFCPNCRLVRRFLWQNTKTLYKRTLSDTGENAISMYAQDKPFTIIDDKKWWSDDWNPLDYGADFDPGMPFFVQFHNLLRRTPLPHLHRVHSTMTNSEYCNAAAGLKNCYLTTNADNSENCHYTQMIVECKDTVNGISIHRTELCRSVDKMASLVL